MAAICAFRPGRTPRKPEIVFAAVNVGVGRIVRLRESPLEGPECVPKPPLSCEHEIRFQISASSLSVRSDVCGTQVSHPSAARQFAWFVAGLPTSAVGLALRAPAMKRVFARARKRPSASRLFGTLRVAHARCIGFGNASALSGGTQSGAPALIIDATSWSLSWARR
jgi:hypothetical protein